MAMDTEFKAEDIKAASNLSVTLRRLAEVLGILQLDPNEFLKGTVDDSFVQNIEEKIRLRNEARAQKNWAEADRIRDELLNQGIVLEDSAGETVWKKVQ